jgi:glutathione S-transferase
MFSPRERLRFMHCDIPFSLAGTTFRRTGSLVVESTGACGQTPLLLVLLEELGAPYELVLRPDGYFLTTYGRPGPKLVDGDLTLFGVAAMLRHCARTRAEGRLLPRSLRELARVDASLELAGYLALTVYALRREEREPAEARRPARINEERAKLSGLLRALEQALDDSDGDWLLGDFGLADCAFTSLPALAAHVDFATWPRVRAYGQRLAARPAVRRVQAHGPSSSALHPEAASCSIS